MTEFKNTVLGIILLGVISSLIAAYLWDGWKNKQNSVQATNAEGIQPMPSTREASPPNSDLVTNLRRLLSNLDRTRNTGDGFDYWPHGGVQIAYFHVATFLSYEQISALSPYPVFVSGPHNAHELYLSEPYTFGHYNQAFLRWFHSQAFEMLQDRAFVDSTKKSFDDNLGYTARNYWLIYTLFKNNPNDFNVLVDDYASKIKTKSLPDAYYYEAGWAALGKYSYLAKLDGNVASPAIYFWARRRLDGTDEEIFSILDLVLRAYQGIPCPNTAPDNVAIEPQCYKL
jgi:hypothetical protein